MSRNEVIQEALLNTIKMQYNSAVETNNSQGAGEPLQKLKSFRDVLATREMAAFAYQLLSTTDVFNTPTSNDVGTWIQHERSQLKNLALAKIRS